MNFFQRLFQSANKAPVDPVGSGGITDLTRIGGGETNLQDAFNKALERRGIKLGVQRLEPKVETVWLAEHGYHDGTDWNGIGELALADREEVEMIGKGVPYLTEPFGDDGALWQDGLVFNRDKTTRFLPLEGRGLQYDHGTFYQTFLECGPFRRSWTNLITPLKTGVWRVKPADITRDDLPYGADFDTARRIAARQARYVETLLMKRLEGGWSKHLGEASLALVQGFSPFVEIYSKPQPGKPSTLRRLQYKWPSSVNRYFRDHDETIVAVEFVDGEGRHHIVSAEHLLLYTWDEFGLDPEGNGYARSVAVWWEILQLASQLEAVAAEKFGSPWVYISSENPGLESRAKPAEIEDLKKIIDAAVAAEDPIIVLPDNTKIAVATTAGALPSFEVMKRFALERLTEILIGESALIAVSKAGSYAARESAQDAAISFAPSIAQWLCEAQNGADNMRTTGTIPKIVDTYFGGPPVPGMYPELEFSLSGFSDEVGTADIISAATAGLVKVTPKVQEFMHDRLGLPAPDEGEPMPAEAVPASVVPSTPLALPAGFRAAEPDYSKLAAELDKFDSKLTVGFSAEINAWLALVKDRLDAARRTNTFRPDDVTEALEALRPALRAKLIAVTQGQTNQIMRVGASSVAREMGSNISATGVDRVADSAALSLRIAAVVNEIINRSEGLVLERFAQFANGETTVSLPRLAESTISLAASKVTSTALNVGRETFVDVVAARASQLGLPNADIIAERSAVMDSNTCEVCRDLDGVRVKFGSGRYYDLAPPNKCLGGSRCRCIYTYILPDEVTDAMIRDWEQ